MTEPVVVGAVLAAGLGTRLRPLTARLPKPLVPMAGRPLVEYALDALSCAGVRSIGVNAHHHGAEIPRALAHRPESLEYVFEETLRGTGGGLKGISSVVVGDHMIAINGDALFDFPLAPFLERHQERGAMATLILRRVPRGSPFGRVGVGPEDRIHVIAEIEGPKAHEHPLVYSAYTGVQIFNTQLMQLVPDEPCDILRTAHRALLERGVPVFGDFAPDDGVWLDVGTLERYLDAHSAFLDGRLSTPGLPPADLEGRRISATADIDGGAVLSGPCAVLDGACIEGGAHVGPGTFVGRRAHIYPGVELTGCVVWDGVEVRRSARDEVFIPEG